jgi:hypothetical protein
VTAVLTCASALIMTADVGRDPDLYWHRVVGAALLHGNWGLDPDPVSYLPGHWYSLSWLADVGYAAIVDWWGYAGVVGLRFVLAAAFFTALLALCCRASATPAASFVVVTVVALTAFPVLQDRPQTISLVLLAGWAGVVDRVYRGGARPRWWMVALLTWTWANLHGLWILVPATLLVLAARAALQRRDTSPRDAARPLLLLALVAAVSGACTPVGPKLLLSAWRVSSSTGLIAEWHPTVPRAFGAWGLVAVLLLVVAGWARAREPVSWGDIAYGLVWAGFGFWAFRNAVPVSVLLAPLAVRSLASVAPHLDRASARAPAWTLLAVAVLGLGAAAVRYTQVPVISPDQPAAIARTLAARGDSHVMATYNISGFIREFGGDGVRVALDGRADRYGSARIERFVEAFRGEGDWRAVVLRYDPDYVVADRVTAFPELLRGLGWRQVQRDGDFVLLAPPGR